MIGRKKESTYLKSLLNEKEPQFVAVFGRRRIGKTYLIRESFDYKFTFEHTGISNNGIQDSSQKKAQLDKFAQSLKNSGYLGSTDFSTWDEAFTALKEVIKKSKKRKKVIFIDEISWMDTRGSGFVSALESFWNGFATARKEKDIILIICASATYWMTDNIVNSKGGFHNRLTGQIHLNPFSLGECEEYIRSRGIILNRHQILQCYMIMGGVPFYWSLLKKGISLPQNIDNIFFLKSAPLENEYDNLYRALFNKADQYMQIAEMLSSSVKGATREEICKKTGIAPSGDLSKKLSELENCGFIRRYIPFGYKSRNSLYQLIDNFTIFYYKFMKNKGSIKNFWQTKSSSPTVKAWSGLAFERVCMEHIYQIKKALGISGVHTTESAWRCSADLERGIFGSQIDLLIIRDDQIINLCEMKYSESGFKVDAEYNNAQRHKISDLQTVTKTKHAIHPTLVTTYEVPLNSYALDIQAIITAEELFDIG